jgi:hypothetical protein
MQMETILARNIEAAEGKAAYDHAVKRLLANKMILAWIMKSCIEEYRNIPVNDIANRFIEGTPEVAETAVHPDMEVQTEQIQGSFTEDSSINEKTVTYDVRFFALAPAMDELVTLIINIEAQNDFYPGYPLIKRALYYCSRMISSQFGRDFSESGYGEIKKVYSIWICPNPPEGRKNTITRYSIAEENVVGSVREKVNNYDLLTAIMICLGEPEGERYDGILKLLEVLLSNEKKAEEKKRILMNDFDIPMTEELESEVLTVCNLSEGVEKRGEQRSTLRHIQNLMDTLKLTAEQAMNALKIPVSEQEGYMKMLKN